MRHMRGIYGFWGVIKLLGIVLLLGFLYFHGLHISYKVFPESRVKKRLNFSESTHSKPTVKETPKPPVKNISKSREPYLPKLYVKPQMNSTKRGDQFHVILTFRLLNITQKAQRKRMDEYIWCLKQFLEIDQVKGVHLIYDSPEMSGFIQENVGQHKKLNLHQVKNADVVLTLHQFAFTHFQGELVSINQGDILLGEGFEKINKTLLKEKRMIYGLSRHESKCGTLKDQCLKYSGSHDMYIFVPKGELNEEAKMLLNHFIFSYGTDNLILYIYQHLLKYKVLNPCKIIKIYHFHCTKFRKYKKEQKWVNKVFDVRSKPVDYIV